jgi:uncharacterized protein YxeA
MKIKNLIIVFILQLIIILGLFIYFYNQNKDLSKQIVYLEITNQEGENDKLKFDISEIDEYVFQYNQAPTNSDGVYFKTNLNLKVGDTVYLKLDQYGSGKSASIILASTDINSINKHSYYEINDMEKKPFIKGTIVEIKSAKLEQGEPTKYIVEYGIEEGEFLAGNLGGGVVKVRINSQGKSTLLEVYKDNKVIYKSLE